MLHWKVDGSRKTAEARGITYRVYPSPSMWWCVITGPTGTRLEGLKDTEREAMDKAEAYAAWKAGGSKPHWMA